MHRIVSNNGDIIHGQRTFVCGIKNPSNCDIGDACLVISIDEVYVINSKREQVILH